MKDKIKLANAHVNQHTTKGVKGDWKIEENITNDAMGELPGRLNHNEVFSILHMARKYELEAFNIGIQFGKEKYRQVFDRVVEDYKLKMETATKENERLAAALDNITRLAN